MSGFVFAFAIATTTAVLVQIEDRVGICLNLEGDFGICLSNTSISNTSISNTNLKQTHHTHDLNIHLLLAFQLLDQLSLVLLKLANGIEQLGFGQLLVFAHDLFPNFGFGLGELRLGELEAVGKGCILASMPDMPTWRLASLDMDAVSLNVINCVLAPSVALASLLDNNFPKLLLNNDTDTIITYQTKTMIGKTTMILLNNDSRHI